jgi:hypothetical protein
MVPIKYENDKPFYMVGIAGWANGIEYAAWMVYERHQGKH